MKLRWHLCLFVLLIIFNACEKKEPPQPQSLVGSDFKVYVDRFKSEAASRGYKIDDTQLSVAYSDTMNYYCGYGIFNTKQVLISNAHASCWQTQNDLDKEKLMFHELGHALLGRVHDNSKLPNGDYKSMMCGGSVFNILFTVYNEDTPEKRKYYLDELFNPAIPLPSWSAEKTTPTIIFRDTLSTASDSWLYKSSGSQQGEISNSVFLSPSTSLEIISSASTTFSYWYTTIDPQGINQSDKLVLTVNIKLRNITEGGVYFALRGDTDARMNFFSTTQGVTSITGTSDFTEYNVTAPYFISTTKKIYIFLMLNGQATGTVNFDDITLTKYE
jgi:hypothetical protein